jgi:hypothetical protein
MFGPPRFPFLAALVVLSTGCLFGSAERAAPSLERPRAEPIGEHSGEAVGDLGDGEPGESDDLELVSAPVETPPAEPEAFAFREPMPGAGMGKSAPANQYANLSPSGCKREAQKRKLPVKDAAAKGVAVPMRLSGPLHGVRFITAPAPSPFGVADCRLLLALDDFAEVLAGFDVVSVQLDSMFRSRARIAGRKNKTSQHAHAMAADIVAFTFADKRRLVVEGNWGASIGKTPCGPDAVLEERSDDIVMLRNMACAVARRGVFHHMLTPSFDAAHRNHLHFDIKRDTKQWAIR